MLAIILQIVGLIALLTVALVPQKKTKKKPVSKILKIETDTGDSELAVGPDGKLRRVYKKAS